MNKEEVYQKISQEVSNRGLTFKQIDKGADYGFIISNHSTNIYGNILSNAIQGENIYQAITKTLYDFYDSNNARNFVVLVDTIENHFLILPYEILKAVMYDRRSGDGVHKDFHITRHPYRLTRNKLPLSEYVDNLSLLFEETKPQDYLEYERPQNQYFLIQVSRPGSENILKNGVYQHENWMDTPHDIAHGSVRIGDILIIYFGSNSIEFQKQIKKIYRVNSVSNNNIAFNVSEIKELNGVSLEQIKSSIQNGEIRREIFNKIGQQGFNIIKMEKSDYDQLLSLDNTPSSSMASLTFRDLQIFLLKEIQMQANYQPIMIRTLLQSAGKATRDNIATKIKELNPGKPDTDFINIPDYEVLEIRGIVKKHGDGDFVLNSVELHEDQRQQLIAICNWKIYNIHLQLEELIEAFDKNRNLFDPDRTPLEELEKLRSAFVSDFPLEKILQLQLDEYVPGKHDPNTGGVNKSTFCYRLEHEMDELSGFGVRTALDFGIYYNREKQQYLHNNKEKYGSPQEAFDVIKSEIYSILKAGGQYHVDHNLDVLLDSLEHKYNISRQIRSKILSVYYPEDFVQMHTLEVVETILQSFGKPTDNIYGRFFLAQAQLLEIKNSHPIMKQWHNYDFSHFVWWAIIQRNTASTKKLYKLSVWVVRAGSKGEQENDALEKNIVTIAWNQLSDLSQVEDKESLKQLYFKSDPNTKAMAVSNMVGSIWRFVNEIKKGDLVVLPLLSQNSKTVAVGRVEGDYEYKELTPDIKHIRPVRWLEKSILKSGFDENTIKHLQIPMTVFQIKDDNAIKGIVKVLKNDIDTEMFNVFESESTGKAERLNKLELRSWQSLTAEDIDEIVSLALHGNLEKERRLAIDPETIKRIIIHLISSKHVILVSPPGTGKTDLGRRLLRELSKRIVRKSEHIEAVASYEWGRYEVIGGNSLKTNNDGNNYAFHLGCVTNAIKEGKLLLIDEFNRADMNKAFGEMFLAIDHGTIQLKEDENPDFDLSLYDSLNNSIRIPEEFRMVCTMNDYDKSLLNELSYGLLRRFAFVEIDAPTNKNEEMDVLVERVRVSIHHNGFSKLATEEVIRMVSPQIDKFLDFMFEVRNKRKLGVSTSIDVAKYIAVGYTLNRKKTDHYQDNNNIAWKLLNEALIDYVLPQLDRLDLDILVYVKEAAYKTLLDNHGKIPDSIKTGFISKLENVISDLDKINRLFATPKTGEV